MVGGCTCRPEWWEASPGYIHGESTERCSAVKMRLTSDGLGVWLAGGRVWRWGRGSCGLPSPRACRLHCKVWLAHLAKLIKLKGHTCLPYGALICCHGNCQEPWVLSRVCLSLASSSVAMFAPPRAPSMHTHTHWHTQMSLQRAAPSELAEVRRSGFPLSGARALTSSPWSTQQHLCLCVSVCVHASVWHFRSKVGEEETHISYIYKSSFGGCAFLRMWERVRGFIRFWLRIHVDFIPLIRHSDRQAS